MITISFIRWVKCPCGCDCPQKVTQEVSVTNVPDAVSRIKTALEKDIYEEIHISK